MSEKRENSRLQFYKSDGILATAEIKKKKYIGYVKDISITGAAIFFDEKTEFKIKDKLEIAFSSKNVKFADKQAFIVSITLIKSGSLVGLCFFNATNDKYLDRQKRYLVNNFLPLCAMCEHPIIKNEYIMFRCVDFNNQGMKLACSLSNNFLLKGMKLNLDVNVPFAGTTSCCVEIVHVQQSEEKKHINIGVKLANGSDSEDYRAKISQYILFTNNESIQALRAERYVFTSSKFFRFKSASRHEFAAIVKLREESYKARNSEISHLDEKMFCDIYDAYSRHIICKINSVLISAIRVVFTDLDAKRSEILSKSSLPKKIKDAGFVEISRLVVKPDYARTSIFSDIIYQAFRITILNKIRYVAISVKSEMIKVYEKMGFVLTGDTYQHEHAVTLYNMVLDLQDLFDESKISKKYVSVFSDLKSIEL